MKFFRNIFSLLAALCLTATALASEVDSVIIRVSLHDDGSALVTERWQIYVTGQITEWYKVIGNLGDMTVGGLQVIDEEGHQFVSEGDEWDIDRSLEEKAGRCGIVRKENGCELCWGVGSSGSHEFTITYSLGGLVQSHEDMDGFNFMFLARGQNPAPQYAEVRIFKEDTTFSSDNSRIWAFGFNGEINFEDGSIVARSNEPFSEKSGLIVLAGFSKGIFSPAVEGKGTFDDLRAKAFKGSSYKQESGIDFWSLIFYLAIGLGILAVIYAFIADAINRRKRRKELLGCKNVKDVPWFRSVPAEGSLRKAFNVYKTFKPDSQAKKNLIAAYVMRLFYKKAFSVTLDRKGRKVLQINEYADSSAGSAIDAGGATSSSDEKDLRCEKSLYEILKDAAGENGIMEKNELKRWSATESNSKLLADWVDDADDKLSLWSLKAKEVREVFGLKNYLQEFTLIDERGVAEVQLWNNYLIFATLFGIADRVYKEIKHICPDYEKLAGLSVEGEDFDLSDVIFMTHLYSTNMYESAFLNSVESSLSDSGRGFGGGSSFGGGGGFSGGGFGGGGR